MNHNTRPDVLNISFTVGCCNCSNSKRLNDLATNGLDNILPSLNEKGWRSWELKDPCLSIRQVYCPQCAALLDESKSDVYPLDEEDGVTHMYNGYDDIYQAIDTIYCRLSAMENIEHRLAFTMKVLDVVAGINEKTTAEIGRDEQSAEFWGKVEFGNAELNK